MLPRILVFESVKKPFGRLPSSSDGPLAVKQKSLRNNRMPVDVFAKFESKVTV